MEVGGVDVDVDGAGEGVGRSVEGEKATRCCTAPQNTSTIFSIGSERN